MTDTGPQEEGQDVEEKGPEVDDRLIDGSLAREVAPEGYDVSRDVPAQPGNGG